VKKECDEDEMPTEHCRVGVFHKMAIDCGEETQEEADENGAEADES
jgi:hypothetical protein